MTTYKNIIEGPRWARSDKFIKELCFIHEVEYKIDRDVGLFKETVYFKIWGDNNDVNIVRRKILEAVKDYNNK